MSRSVAKRYSTPDVYFYLASVAVAARSSGKRQIDPSEAIPVDVQAQFD